MLESTIDLMLTITADEQFAQPKTFITVGLAATSAYQSLFNLLTSKKVIGQSASVFFGASVEIVSSQLALGASLPCVTVLSVMICFLAR